MKIFIDFDDVLFCSKDFIDDFKKIFKNNGIPEKVFVETYYPGSEKNKKIKKYNFKKQINLIEGLGYEIKNIKKEIDYLISNSKNYLFEDSVPFLEKNIKHKIFLISFSKTKFQEKKIKYSGICKFFSRIIITDGRKSKEIKKLIMKDERAVFIDDRIEQIKEAKNKNDKIITILFQRRNGRHCRIKDKGFDFRARKLAEVSKIINKLNK